MLKWKFWERAAPVTVSLADIVAGLGLDSSRYTPCPDMHRIIQIHMGGYTLRGNSHYGPARAFFQNPKQTIVIKAPERQFRDEPEAEDEVYQSSACIAFTEESRGGGKKLFSLMIRTGGQTLEELYDGMVFGLQGVYSPDGQLRVTRLILPGKDNANRMTPARAVDITPENVRLGLAYAARCAESLSAGGPFYPRACLDRAIRAQTPKDGSAPKAP